jgi:hypothetical protein
LKPQQSNKGYLRIGLTKDGQQKKYYIHRLVAEAYLPNPDNKSDVNHKDENILNNCLNNLEWMTRRENTDYGTRNERISKALGKTIMCVETGEIFDSYSKAAASIGRASGGISNCIRGLQQTCGGYHWVNVE